MLAADIPAVVDLMAAAFQNAALYRYLEADGEKRRDLLRVVFQNRIPASFHAVQGELAIDGGLPVGAALWSPPIQLPALPPSAPRHENAALNEAVRRFGPAVYEKWTRFHAVLFGALAHAYPAPHWSLSPIAVLPPSQGKGIASSLIRAKLAEIDQRGDPCLLATQDQVNTLIYARYGFTIIQEDAIDTLAGLKTYCLLRHGA
jgi:ribosomal protein S18 acetylase RimI-like enzyme